MLPYILKPAFLISYEIKTDAGMLKQRAMHP